MGWLEDAISQVADAQPQQHGPALLHPVVKGRVLLVDGDYLAYYCAGNDETDPGRARRNAIERLENMRDAAGCEKIVVHLTSLASTKGDRFIIATVQPYQGKRSGKRPKNWAYLRDWMEGYSGPLFTKKVWGTREADDGMTYHAAVLGVDLAVIATADKDLRMSPGWHISWKEWFLTRVGQEDYEVIGCDELLYGTKWLWMQTLTGDDVDYIPGLPWFVDSNGTQKRMGKVTAARFLAGTKNDQDALIIVAALYRTYYKDDWADRLVEQLGLLWMRRDINAEVDDFVGWFFYERNDPIHAAMFAASQRMVERVRQAKAEVETLCN